MFSVVRVTCEIFSLGYIIIRIFINYFEMSRTFEKPVKLIFQGPRLMSTLKRRKLINPEDIKKLPGNIIS